VDSFLSAPYWHLLKVFDLNTQVLQAVLKHCRSYSALK